MSALKMGPRVGEGKSKVLKAGVSMPADAVSILGLHRPFQLAGACSGALRPDQCRQQVHSPQSLVVLRFTAQSPSLELAMMHSCVPAACFVGCGWWGKQAFKLQRFRVSSALPASAPGKRAR